MYRMKDSYEKKHLFVPINSVSTVNQCLLCWKALKMSGLYADNKDVQFWVRKWTSHLMYLWPLPLMLSWCCGEGQSLINIAQQIVWTWAEYLSVRRNILHFLCESRKNNYICGSIVLFGYFIYLFCMCTVAPCLRLMFVIRTYPSFNNKI